ncbi:MFS transporter [Alteribacillus iranensis]|uniref:MFS transporter, DHA1 family, purine base/nucleoside efflux pump n=1 Tax=Alteribacillus iranensis TaxID=930128 RepID=A0A1I2CZ07_9BACI|nr:MFS transporter [Alteribacillus iranensis]SFE73462.1 MFS transporter, DHA1 family, purine base/nucleoside efflux pump [Alteribacillus iranensis]
MDKRVYLLMLVSFVAGLAELIIVGLLDLIAADLHVSIRQAGLLITAFSVTFAISAPILLFVTSKMERKRLTLISLGVFLVGNVAAAFSPSFSLLMLARILSAASGSLLVVLSITIASNISTKPYRGRAIGLIYIGISGSLVLGVPIGLMIGNYFGWQAPFLAISALSAIIAIGIFFLMQPIEVQPSPGLKKQWQSLKNRKLLSAHVTTLLFLAGHYHLYGYLSPYLKQVMGFSEGWVTIVYWLFGFAAVTGGAIGGGLSDRLGYRTTLYVVIILFSSSMFILPYTTAWIPLFFLLVVIWGAMSWALSPPMQSYLVESASETSDVQQSLNNSALHLGIALGSFSGGFVVENSSIALTPTVGAVFVLLSFGTAYYSLTKRRQHSVRPEVE